MTPKVEFYPDKVVDTIRGWWWTNTDSGAWDGPKRDWEESHRDKILIHTKNFGTVIQAGGNHGMYAKLLSRMFQTVFTFEPDYLNFQALSLNCTEPNIIKTQGALGARNDLVEIHKPSMSNTGMHRVETSRNGHIPVYALDSIADNYPKIDLIMLDIEGYELYALQGAAKIIDRYRPTLMIERPSSEVHELLSELWGYKPVSTSFMDTVFIS